MGALSELNKACSALQKGAVGTLLNLVIAAILTRCLAKAGLAKHASTHAHVVTANAIQYCINGVMYSAAANTDITLTAAAQAAGTYCMYMVTIDSGGTFAATKGTEVDTDTAVLPAVPANKCCVGAIKIHNGTASAFTLGTTALNAADITATYYDLSRPTSGSDALSALT